MTHVLVTGANGYIASEVATNLRRRGHIVYGLVRRQADADVLVAKEIIPVIGDQSALNTIPQAILDKVSVIIDSVMNVVDRASVDTNRNFARAAAESSRRTGVKKRYIYISGCMDYGDHGIDSPFVDETSEAKGMKPRVEFQKEFMASSDLYPVVVRPAWVYGGRGNPSLAHWWRGNADGDIEIFGNPKKMRAWVHVQDLAEAFGLIVDAPTALVAGETFDVCDDSRVTVEQVQVSWARAAGVKGKVVYKPVGSDYFAQQLENVAVPLARKIRIVLGWQPRHGSVLDQTYIYYPAYVASQLQVERKK